MSRQDLRQLVIDDIKLAYPANADKAEEIVDYLLSFDFMQDEGVVAAFMDSYRKVIAKREARRGV